MFVKLKEKAKAGVDAIDRKAQAQTTLEEAPKKRALEFLLSTSLFA